MKILILAGSNNSTANGITISNLFKNWDSNSLAIVEYHSNIDEIIRSNVHWYYLLGDSEVRRGILRLFTKSRPSKSLVINNPKKSVNRKIFFSETIRSHGFFLRLIGRLRIFLLYSSGLIYVSRSYKVSSSLTSFIEGFAPDFIYSTCEDINKMKFAIDLQKKTSIPLCIHVFDDWIENDSHFLFAKCYWKKRKLEVFSQLLNQSTLRLSISDEKSVVYEQRYGFEFNSFHNTANDAFFQRSVAPSIKDNNSFVFTYTGVVNTDTAPALNKFFRAIDHINSKGLSGNNCELKIYSPYDANVVLSHLDSCVHQSYKGKVDYSELPSILQISDGLLLPIDDNKRTREYLRLSMSTKVSEFLASGSHIFCLAPSEIALYKYLEMYDLAFCTSDYNLISLVENILIFIADDATRMRHTTNAKSVALVNHSTEGVTNKLYQLLKNETNY